MSIASEITRLQTAKADLKTAIEGKGVTVSSSAKLDAYPALVESISGGSIEDLITKENLVSIVSRFDYGAGVTTTLDVNNNFIVNDVFIGSEVFRMFTFTFKDITLQVMDDTVTYNFNGKRIKILSVNNIDIEIDNTVRYVIHFYLNNEIIGTINYTD